MPPAPSAPSSAPAAPPAPAAPLVLAGPILRRLTPARLTIWLALRTPARIRLSLDAGDGPPRRHTLEPGKAGCRHLAAGARLHYLLLDLALDPALPTGGWIGYDLALQPLDGDGRAWQGWQEWAPDLCYPGKSSPGFVLMPTVHALLHGSCRRPHHLGGDGLAAADRLLARCIAAGSDRPGAAAAHTAGGTAGGEAHAGVATGSGDQNAAGSGHTAPAAPPGHGADADGDALPAWPSALVMSGDQIYADDVAGPMLRAIHRLIAALGLPAEAIPGTDDPALAEPGALYAHPAGYYRREALLPRLPHHRALVDILFGGAEKPVFTTANAHNHLITLAEVLAMYLLVWSPVPWQGLEIDPPPTLDARERALFAQEQRALEAFVVELPAVRRVFAHLPVAMIFDDHDITDDWNLSREWEETAYGHAFSRRVLGNALAAYLINQGWGNCPEAFPPALLDALAGALAAPGSAAHDACIEQLQAFDTWHYEWPTTPPLVVIDTRTHRWRSELAARRPSGLLDWEALTDLQHTLRGHPAVLLVSPAPIFGVKLIEVIQRLFTWLGHPLLVDAENWMAHRGAAQAILNIFRHRKTPRHFVVLSGDVHYSFVYDVELRGRVRGPDIWQICSSGVRNEFPPRLLAVLDRANRWLYSPRSPLNWLTRRRRMRVIPRTPEGAAPGRRLLNGSGIGLVELDADGAPWRIREFLGDGRSVRFLREEAESRWE